MPTATWTSSAAPSRADWVRGTILVEVTAEDRDPDIAAEIATTVAAVLVDGDVVDEVAGPTFDDLVLTTSDAAEPPATFARPDLRLALGIGLLLAVALATVGCGAPGSTHPHRQRRRRGRGGGDRSAPRAPGATRAT